MPLEPYKVSTVTYEQVKEITALRMAGTNLNAVFDRFYSTRKPVVRAVYNCNHEWRSLVEQAESEIRSGHLVPIHPSQENMEYESTRRDGQPRRKHETYADVYADYAAKQAADKLRSAPSAQDPPVKR